MFKKLSNSVLIIILVVLVALYFGKELLDNSGKSSSLRETLVEIDTTAVSRIVISKPGSSTELLKEGNDWKVLLDGGKKVDAVSSKAKSTIDLLLQAKPSRLVSKKESKWKEFQVDSTGTSVQVFEGDEKTLDIILGRFGTKQGPNAGGQPQFNRNNFTFFSYARLNGEKETYACDDFMGSSLASNSAEYRNFSIVQLDQPDSITALRFTYPADSGFVANQLGGSWQIDGSSPDSTNMAQYLGVFRQANSRNFIDDIEIETLTDPLLTLIIESKTEEQPIKIRAFDHPNHGWLLHSSQNPKSLFASPTMKEKLFISKFNLLKSEN